MRSSTRWRNASPCTRRAIPEREDEAELMQLDAISDLVLYYDDLFAALSIEDPVLVGHSFGGMVAAEYAAYFNSKVRKLVLIDALGLWVDATPVADINGMADQKIPALLFADASGFGGGGSVRNAVRSGGDGEDDRHARVDARRGVALHLADSRSRSAPAPVPHRGADARGVGRRPTDTCRRCMPMNSSPASRAPRKPLIAGAGHFPHVEKQRETADAVLAFAAR